MSSQSAPIDHYFTRKEVNDAEHIFLGMIEKYFGEVWKMPWNGEYRGVSWDCRSPLILEAGLWRLTQGAKHKGAFRAAGKIEVREGRSLLRFILFFNPVYEKGIVQ